MRSFFKSLALYLLAAAAIWAAFSFHKARAQGFTAEQHFDVAFTACDASHCEHFKVPVDADNSVACMMTAGMHKVVEWTIQHPGWTAKEWHCAKDGEQDL